MLAEDAPIVDAVLEDVGLDLVRGALPGLPKRSSPPIAASLAARSMATQHISLDETYCCGFPRASQIP